MADLLGRSPGEALCPERYDREALLRIRNVVGDHTFAALYQQRPAPAEGNIFKRKWWKFWQPAGANFPDVAVRLADGSFHRTTAVVLPREFNRTIQSWDMAFKDEKGSDYVVGQPWSQRGAQFYLRDQVRERLSFPATCQAVVTMTARYPEGVAKLVEDKANGPAVLASLRKSITGLIPVEPQGGKIARAQAVSPLVEAGNVFLPHPQLCPWVVGFIDRFASFPSVKWDDEIDALSQALVYLNRGSLAPNKYPTAHAHL